jgi:predicted ATPase/class 3 adenylate cyclase
MDAPTAPLPTGTVTFLRTDVEGSMALARALGSGWDALNASQMAIIRSAILANQGITVRSEGDAIFAVFREALPAALAAIDIQRRIAAHEWPDDGRVRVRIGLHSGEAHLAGDDYGGFDVNRAARIAAAGHGGQVVLSDATRALIAADLPPGCAIRDLGRHALKDVPQPERLFQLDIDALPTDFPPLRTAVATTGNLPPRLTSFVAREAEVAEIRRLLGTARLVTITGPGGIGKTSLATEAARAAAASFADGAWHVPLDPVSEPELVPATIARVLGIYDGPTSPVAQRLVRYLAEREMLLVLDNFEHLLDAAPRVAELLRGAPPLRIIVTSRAPLHLAGEQEFPIATLDAHGDRSDAGGPSAAARLFVDRARAVRPGWDPSDGDRPVVEQIVQLVDRLPLGIELAAARVALLPLAAIRDRLAARLPLPGAGPRDAPARQRTLDGTIAWSYDLLDHDHQRLVRELAVFEAGFDVEQVALAASLAPRADPLDAVVDLADKSLVTPSAVETHHDGLGTVRYRMLETIRAFALRQLAEAGAEPAARQRHAVAMLDLAERAAPHLPGADQARWLDRLALDHANLGAALRWAVEAGDVAIAQRLAWATWRYWQLAGHLNEGRALVDAVVAMPRADEPSPARMWSLAAAGGLAYWQADVPAANALYHEQLTTALQIGDQAGEADACFNLATTESIAGNVEPAMAFLERARALYALLGDDIGLARIDGVLAIATMMQGHLTEALAMAGAARERYRGNGDVMYEALSAGTVAFAHLLLGATSAALRNGIEALRLTHALRDVASTVITFSDSAVVLATAGLVDEAATTLAAYYHLCDLHGVQPPGGIGPALEPSLVAELTSEAHADAISAGRSMSLDEAVAFLLDSAERALSQSRSE